MLATLIFAQLATAIALAEPCEELTRFRLENGRVVSAAAVPAGPFTPPRGAGPAAVSAEPLPAHCRVTMVLEPSADSNIGVELWMPLEGWNGKFLAVGNGGWAGAIQGYADMQDALRRGYATAATDTGHSAADGPAGMFALGHPEKLVDFAYRAVHDMTVKSKRVIHAFYDDPIDYSYFKGCSTGGRQAVMAAQRFAGDFDGIIAGALANRHVRMHTAASARAIRLARHPEEAIGEAKAALVNEAVMRQCDTLGEGFLNNPEQCSFDFASLACPDTAAEDCLTPGELRSVETYYGGVRTSRGDVIFAGQAISVPLPAMASREEAPSAFAFDTVRILGFQDPSYDWRTFDLDRDLARIDAAAGFVDAVDPDLRAFKAHGGKLLLYAGWNDAGITPLNTLEYYESVLAELGPEQADWLRLFMVPGMEHCRGGPGPSTFDALGALEMWREQGMQPDVMVGRNPGSGLTRPICPYPRYARYDGEGDLAEASSFICAVD